MTKDVKLLEDMGLQQPPDNYYNNTDSAWYAEDLDRVDDGGKEVREGEKQNKDANTKFKFLI